MNHIRRINHVAIVVDDIEEALKFWRDGLGLEVDHVEDVPDQHSLVAFLPTGDSEIELVKPTSEDVGVANFLQKHGPGMHHICFEVDNIEHCLDKLKENKIRLINEEPIIGTGGKRIAFVHPESTHGVLVELYELTPDEPKIRLERATKLTDRALAQGQIVAAGALEFLRNLTKDDGPRAKGGGNSMGD
jgi:methylmalonyl-CoA/ethylmalonyl-CoA epimerase